MEKIALHPFCEIEGIGAASGIVYHRNSLYIISDNSTYLYEYKLLEKQLERIKLMGDSEENLAKKDKADFESVTLYNNKLYIHGSGSTDKRQIRVKYDLDTLETQKKDVSKRYHKLSKSIGLALNELNIEGCIIDTESYYYFQRGNGTQGQNGIFKYTRHSKEVVFTSVVLPKVKGIEATFTDAIAVDDDVYFLAACEDTTSTYTDGEIYGTFLGCMERKTNTVRFTHLLSDTHKFEGLALYQKSDNVLEFFLCEDNDTEGNVSTIYIARVSV